jgi:6-pyruvoyltetrahydropterin/6-carboxytetrahydropterin synthase
MFRVVREVKFCFGHRLVGYEGKCSRLHGHNARAFFAVEASKLDRTGMAVDFAHVKRTLKKWIDDNLDHKCILRTDDPLRLALEKVGEPTFALDANPTTENIAKLLFDQARRLGVPVVETTVWENDANVAVYSDRGSFRDSGELGDEDDAKTTLVAGSDQTGRAAAQPMTQGTFNGPFFVTREFKFCFGHRLMNYPGKCRQLHGHNGRLLVTVESDKLDEIGMAADFGVLKKGVDSWIDAEWDHAMILHKNDPVAPILRDFGSAVVSLDENPTTENLARAVYRRATENGLNVAAVQLWETDSCSAGYAPPFGENGVPW